MRIALGVMVAVTLGCGGASATQFRGADGFPGWWYVRGERGEALRLVGDRCPDGYDLKEETKAGITIRCKGTPRPRPPQSEFCAGALGVTSPDCASSEARVNADGYLPTPKP